MNCMMNLTPVIEDCAVEPSPPAASAGRDEEAVISSSRRPAEDEPVTLLIDALLGPARFQPGDRVRVRSYSCKKTTWTVVRRDFWHTDTEPAYMLQAGKGEDAHTRFAFDSDLEPVIGSHG